MPTRELHPGVHAVFAEADPKEYRFCPRCSEKCELQTKTNREHDEMFRHVCKPCRYYTPYRRADGSDESPLSAFLSVTDADIAHARELQQQG